MSNELIIVPFRQKYEQEWDRFVSEDAVNGTFLQSRNFLNYHPKERFVDCSCLMFKGDKLIAVVPGCVVNDSENKIFSSHSGSTFGGLVIHKKHYYASYVIDMIKMLESYLQNNGFTKCVLKITPDLFCKEKSDLLEYALTYCGYDSYSELSTYIDFDDYNKDFRKNFSHGQKENLKYALKKGMRIKIMSSDDAICEFHDVLVKNLLKFDTKPVHSKEELMDFKNNRLKDIVDFYGVYYEEKMIAGTMLFKFGQTLHTQYLAADAEYYEYRPMTFLYYNLIELAQNSGYKKLSWGISTEKQGTVLNESLVAFKESFGSKYALNKGFYKQYMDTQQKYNN